MTWFDNKILRRCLLSGVVLATLAVGAPLWAAEADSTATVIDPARAWEDIAVARDAAARDSHHEAVADYLSALSHDARLVPVVAREIAYQKLWREDADKAIFYFKRHLARHPDTDNRDVLKGLALAYSWSGRQAEAIAIYRDLVDRDGLDGDAAVGLGRTLIWDNRLREGFRVLRGVETGFPADTGPGRESANFLLTYLDGYETPVGLRLNSSWDSDGLDIHRLSAVGSFTVLGNKLLQVEPSFALFRHDQHADINAPRLKVGFIGSLAHNVSFHAYGWLDAFRSGDPLFGGTEKLDWLQPGADAWITWLPAPRLRLDFGAASQPVETYYALNQHIHLEQGSVSADWRFARRWSLGGTASAGTYSDGNDRTRGLARLTWRREGTWEVHAGPVLYYMDYALPYPGGYWAPDWVRNGSVELTLKTRTRKWTVRLNGSLGQEKETGADSQTVGGASARVGWRISSGTLIAAEAGYSRSSFASDSGYRRTFAGLSLRGTY